MDQQRLFIAIAVSVAILLGFQLLIVPHLPQPPKPPRRRSPAGQTAPAAGGRTAPARRSASDDAEGPKEVPRVQIAAPRPGAPSACWARGWTSWCSPTIARRSAKNSPRTCGCWSRCRREQPYYIQYGWSAGPGETGEAAGQ